jgi:plasmid stabilization system protein ParE
MLKIKWSKNALSELASTLSYLEETFTNSEIVKLQSELSKLENLLATNPYVGKSITERQNVKKLVILKYNSLYYSIDLVQNEILVLSFFSNRRHPNKIKINLEQ